MWFQQVRATTHTTKLPLTAVRATFLTHGSSRLVDLSWPLRSPDNSILRFLAVGSFKITRLCYETRTLGELQTVLVENDRKIGGATLVKVKANFRKRLTLC